MFSFKRSLIALVGVLVLVGVLAAVMPLIGRGQGQPPFAPRKFYLTPQAIYSGSEAPSACAAGYHMASLWEIFDTSNLRYDTQLGLTLEDSGSGPPTGIESDNLGFGWIRTGGRLTSSTAAGEANCFGYSTSSGNGTVVGLGNFWVISSPIPANVISPWSSFTQACNQMRRVWCVQD